MRQPDYLVDDEDRSLVAPYHWVVKANRYIVTYVNGKELFMHRLILGDLAPWPSVHVDHRDGNGFDNRRHNLRISTPAQNQHNARKRKDNTSGYKGVSRKDGAYRYCLYHNGKQVYLGSARTAEAAHELYKIGSVKYYGEFANHG